MAAMTASTTHAPVMAALLVFELSGDYAIVLPLLLATALATALSRRMDPDSIYAGELRRRGVVTQMTIEGRRVTRHPQANAGGDLRSV
jgi:CIC family chloride channel protein